MEEEGESEGGRDEPVLDRAVGFFQAQNTVCVRSYVPLSTQYPKIQTDTTATTTHTNNQALLRKAPSLLAEETWSLRQRAARFRALLGKEDAIHLARTCPRLFLKVRECVCVMVCGWVYLPLVVSQGVCVLVSG